MHTVVKHDPSIAACIGVVSQWDPCVSGQRRNFPGAAIFPRKYGRYVQLERSDFLGNFVSATIFPSDRFSCDTGHPCCLGTRLGTRFAAIKLCVRTFNRDFGR